MTQSLAEPKVAEEANEQRQGRLADRCAMVIFGASGDDLFSFVSDID